MWWPLRVGLAAIVVLNFALIAARFVTDADMTAIDYDVLARASEYPNPYTEGAYVWSPVAVFPLRLLVPLGMAGWVALHALALVPLGWLGLVVALSYPFVVDVQVGNVFTFVAVAGFLAMRGSRVAMIAFCIMAMLMPRPIMLPLLGWLLWKEPWTRVPFAAIALVHLGAVAGTGLADEWAVRLVNLPEGIAHPLNVSPSRWIGYAWVPIGLALAAFLTWKGRLGLASLAASPYLYPMYWLMVVLDLRHADVRGQLRASPARSSTHGDGGRGLPRLDDVLVRAVRGRRHSSAGADGDFPIGSQQGDRDPA